VLIARIAGEQHGVASRAQLLAAGVAAGAIERRVRGGRLHPLHRGVYAVGHRAVDGNGRDLAAVLACGAGAVLSHQSAAARWEMIRGVWRGPVHVTASRGGERAGIVVHRARALHPDDTTRDHGIPTTSPARCSISPTGFPYVRSSEPLHRRRFSSSPAGRNSPRW